MVLLHWLHGSTLLVPFERLHLSARGITYEDLLSFPVSASDTFRSSCPVSILLDSVIGASSRTPRGRSKLGCCASHPLQTCYCLQLRLHPACTCVNKKVQFPPVFFLGLMVASFWAASLFSEKFHLLHQ